MKMAVLISGHIRDAENYYAQNYNFFIKDVNPDIYIHSYECNNFMSVDSFYKPQIGIYESEEKCINKANLNIKILTAPKAPETNLLNLYNMWRKRKLVYNLIFDKNYDKILLTRFDLFIEQNICNFLDHENLCIPACGNYGGICDMVAWGTQEQIKYYCSLFDNIDNYVLNNRILIHPEIILAHHLKDQSIKRIDCKVYLKNGIIL